MVGLPAVGGGPKGIHTRYTFGDADLSSWYSAGARRPHHMPCSGTLFSFFLVFVFHFFRSARYYCHPLPIWLCHRSSHCATVWACYCHPLPTRLCPSSVLAKPTTTTREFNLSKTSYDAGEVSAAMWFADFNFGGSGSNNYTVLYPNKQICNNPESCGMDGFGESQLPKKQP